MPPDPTERRDWLLLTIDPLDLSAAVNFVTDPRAGGIDVFLGTTRAEISPDGKQLLALNYEAYERMAIEQFVGLGESAREKFEIVKLAILHRLGRVEVTEPSVIIAVSSPHRAQAFEACRFLIDQLKLDVTIWKKEVWSTGEETWVHP